MKVLVTGGAGYIGSITVEKLLDRGDEVTVIDNLTTGHSGALFTEAEFHNIDLKDTEDLIKIFKEKSYDAVVHFAASSLVGESVSDPEIYMKNNVGGTLSLLSALKASGINKIVFSSTAATYGEPKSVPITENSDTIPTNPYGLTKLFMEQAMRTYDTAYGLKSVCLRYFNAAGATLLRGEHHKCETHLIPLVLQVAQGKRPHISVFGEDYGTPDGTCIRDYIHVEDLAAAHLAALDYLYKGGESTVCNLGNGEGYSVNEVIETCRKVTGQTITAVQAERRAGDPARLIASSEKAREILGWIPKKPKLETIVQDAWNWHSKNPNGYGLGTDSGRI